MTAGAESKTMYSDIASLVEETEIFVRWANHYGILIPNPDDCAVCGIHKARSGLHYSKSLGYHTWVEPSNEMRLKRMKARRQLKSSGISDRDISRG